MSTIIRNNPQVRRLFIAWAILFGLTLTVNGLDFRALLAAFMAWFGGLVTYALLDEVDSARTARHRRGMTVREHVRDMVIGLRELKAPSWSRNYYAIRG